MTKRQFYIDTADTGRITDIISWLRHQTPENIRHLRGVTTNPNAMAKVGAVSLHDWRAQVAAISATLQNYAVGEFSDKIFEVHVQVPNTELITGNQVMDFIEMMMLETDIPNIRLGVKIHPNMVGSLSRLRNSYPQVAYNVTGLADYASVLRVASYGVNYASIIPGRMEEAGIDANDHLSYLTSCNMKTTNVIAGSMRTVRGLSDAFTYGTIPTIGTRVWEALMLSDIDFYSEFLGDTSVQTVILYNPLPVEIDERSVDLTVNFFKDMDQLGIWAYTGLLNVGVPVEDEGDEDE